MGCSVCSKREEIRTINVIKIDKKEDTVINNINNSKENCAIKPKEYKLIKSASERISISEEELQNKLKESYLKKQSKDDNNNFENIKIDVKNLITQNKARLQDVYIIQETIGKGSYGVINKVVHIQTGYIRAMKTIKKIDLIHFDENENLIVREIELLKEIQHPNIVKIFEYFEDVLNYYLIMEYLPEGDLLNVLHDKVIEISDTIISILIRQLLSAVCFIHDKGIMHGDIKLENILVEKFDLISYDEISVKLGDFGFSNRFYKEETLNEKIGSPYYLAPEVIKKEYTEKCDEWACGVVMFFLLSGETQFDGNTNQEIKEKILIGEYKMKDEYFKSVPQVAKDLIKQLLTYDYKERISAKKALENEWLCDDEELRKSVYEDSNNEMVAKRIMKFEVTEKLQHVTLAFIVHNIDDSYDLAKLRKLFQTINTKNDGKITPKELLRGLREIQGNNITESEVLQIFENLDQDKSGFVEYEEFLRATLDYKKILSEKNLKTAFDNFDKNKDGKLDKTEIQAIFQANTNYYFDLLLSKFNKKEEQVINFDEFKNLMTNLVEEILSNNNSLRSLVQSSNSSKITPTSKFAG